MNELGDYVLGLGDDCLILSHRLAEWTARAPELEEDVALANIALDLLGQARMLLTYAGQVEAAGRTEDDLAYLRGEREFRNVQLVELPNGDFAQTIARLLCFSTYQMSLYDGLRACADPTLAAVAAKGVKEVAYHRDHAVQWTLRLGDGTDESHRRMQAGLAAVWPYTHELFLPYEGPERLRGLVVDPASLRPAWSSSLAQVLAEATLSEPDDDGWRPGGGRRGLHTEAMGYLLAEVQHLHRAHPGSEVVTMTVGLAELRALVAAVPDPEIPVLTIADLGVLRDVSIEDGRVTVTITPTYSGCPAMDAIADDVRRVLADAGHPAAEVRTALAPAWTTDWMSEAGRRKLEAYGIAPPSGRAPVLGGPVPLALSVRCPQCGSLATRELSRFGSTACKSLWVCEACREPFDHFKAI